MLFKINESDSELVDGSGFWADSCRILKCIYYTCYFIIYYVIVFILKDNILFYLKFEDLYSFT